MKKENRKLAQERKKAEREKQEKIRKFKKFLLFFLPCAALIAIILIFVFYANRETSPDSSASQSSSSAATGSSIVETNNSAYDSDPSLTVKDGDSLNIDYTGTVDGKEFEGGSTDGSGTVLVVGAHSYIDDFEEQLIGHHPGETVEVKVTFPEEYGVEDLNGKDAVFQVTINGIYIE